MDIDDLMTPNWNKIRENNNKRIQEIGYESWVKEQNKIQQFVNED